MNRKGVLKCLAINHVVQVKNTVINCNAEAGCSVRCASGVVTPG